MRLLATYAVCRASFTKPVATEFTQYAIQTGRLDNIYVAIHTGGIARVLLKDNS